MTEMVRLDGLAKRFGPVHAVEEVSFGLERGEVLGFLGPNGAGKSTTMRMLTGFIPPSAGTASVMGFDVVRKPIEAKKRLGYLPEGAPLYGDMTPAGFLRFVAEMRGLDGKDAQAKIGAAVERTQLAEVLHRPIETLSKGFKRRVGIAQAIMHDPPVLVLDEPTDGLDPNQKHEVRKLSPDGRGQGDHHLHPHPGGGGGGLHPGGRDRPRPGRGRREAGRAQAPLALPQCRAAHAQRQCGAAGRAAPGRAAGRGRRSRSVGKVNGVATLIVLPRAGAEIVRPVDEVVQRERIVVDEFAVEQGRLDDVFRELTLKAH